MLSDDKKQLSIELDEISEFFASAASQIDDIALAESRYGSAIVGLVARVIGSWHSVRTLSLLQSDKFWVVLDMATILRAAYEAWIQAEFIFHNDSKREDRTTAYFEHRWIEAERNLNNLGKQDNQVARLVQQHQRVVNGLPEIQRRASNAKRVRKDCGFNERTANWYSPLSLEAVARDAGFGDEHHWFVRQFHGAVHSSWTAIRYQRYPANSFSCAIAAILVARCLKLEARALDLSLPESIQSRLDYYCQLTWIETTNEVSDPLETVAQPMIPRHFLRDDLSHPTVSTQTTHKD